MKFQIEVSKILEILSTKIYDSPYALLRENVQNAYDAILMRLIPRADGQDSEIFDPRIDVTISADSIEVTDNGIGMTLEDQRNHFWRAGSSSKDNPKAIAAGVVGTFGIGGLANFGVCRTVTVISESASNNIRTKCQAHIDTLSLEEDCITQEDLPPLNEPGTIVIAEFLPDFKIDIAKATTYLKTFVKHLSIPVYINGNLESKRPLEESCQPEGVGWTFEEKTQTDRCECNLKFQISETGIVWIEMDKIILNKNPIKGKVLLKQRMGQIMSYRSGFGLATTGVSSSYSFGGVANLDALQPTAGRESLTAASIQILQSLVSSAEQMIAPIMAESPYVDLNTDFMGWASKRNRYELLGNLKATLRPKGEKITLKEVGALAEKLHVNYYKGTDESHANAFTSEATPLIWISRSNPRARCEEGYLERYTKASLVSGEPQIIEIHPETAWSRNESALAFRIGQILESDYLLPVNVQFGKITHNLAILVKEDEKPPILTLDSSNPTIETLLECYRRDYDVYNKFTKDFIRTIVFSRISKIIPSAMRDGAEAYMNRLRRQRIRYTINHTEVDAIEKKILEGAPLAEALGAAVAAMQKQQQVVTVQDMEDASFVMPSVINNQKVLETQMEGEMVIPTFEAKEAIQRSDIETEAKLLVLKDSEIMYGYKGLLRLSERAYDDRADFFFLPHFTEIVWGGQKIIYIFRDEVGIYGFYYEIQLTEYLSIPTGGEKYETMTVFLQDSVFLPIPSDLFKYFVPNEDEEKRFDIRYDILYPE